MTRQREFHQFTNISRTIYNNNGKIKLLTRHFIKGTALTLYYDNIYRYYII